jgi:hypothetical protein
MACGCCSRYPLFAMTAALSLAIGIGANTAVFTIGNSLLRFSPVAVSEPERLVDIGRSFDGLPIGFNPASYPDYLDIRRRTTTLEHVYAHPLFPKDMTVESEAGTEKVVGDVVTTNYFAALGTRALIGRLFLPEESDAQGANPLVVLSHRYWVRSFNADPGIVGQTVRLNRYPVTVVGVAPEGFQGTTVVAVDLWVPMSMVTFVTGSTPGGLDDRRAGWVVMGARLKPGASIEQATADVAGIDRALRSEYPSQSHPQPFRLLPASPMADKMPLAAAAFAAPRCDCLNGARDRVRECGWVAPRARLGARTGDGAAAGSWREPIAPDSAAADRDPAAVRDRCRRRDGARAGDDNGAHVTAAGVGNSGAPLARARFGAWWRSHAAWRSSRRCSRALLRHSTHREPTSRRCSRTKGTAPPLDCACAVPSSSHKCR